MGAERRGRELTGRGAAVLRAWRFLTLVLAALALTMTSAHVLELPQKMAYPPDLYAAVNTTLYRYFATVGAVWEYGHATGFVIQLAGFCALLVSVLVETPGASLVGRGSRTARADTDRRAA